MQVRPSHRMSGYFAQSYAISLLYETHTGRRIVSISSWYALRKVDLQLFGRKRLEQQSDPWD